MIPDSQIPEPFLFNALKHHLGFMKEFVSLNTDNGTSGNNPKFIKELKHLGTSVMDVYSGDLPINQISDEVQTYLDKNNISAINTFSEWTGTGRDDFRIISISDGSQWTLKSYENKNRFIHLFPARNSRLTFRVKSNTLKSALIYNITIGKDFISIEDLNSARALLGLSPVKDTIDAEAILEMIEILRD
jgi:hypothetical protein